MFVPKLANCMGHLFHLNEVKFNFLKKLFVCFCFDLDPETECKLYADKLKQSKNFKIELFCQNLTESQVIFFSAPTNIPNMKALVQILFEISCAQDFHILFSKGHKPEKGHNSDMKKNTGQLFFHEESVYEISKP